MPYKKPAALCIQVGVIGIGKKMCENKVLYTWCKNKNVYCVILCIVK